MFEANPFASSPLKASRTDSDADSFDSNEAHRDSLDGKDSGDDALRGLLMFESSQFKKVSALRGFNLCECAKFSSLARMALGDL